MDLKGGTGQACAACKHQRRKCSPDCPLAPYFPADQPKKFQNVHKLFGVKKIQRLLESLNPNQRYEAMVSIIFQADVRDQSPVHGCWGVIRNLHYQIYLVQEELNAVHAQIQMHRQQQQQELQLFQFQPQLNNLTSNFELQQEPYLSQNVNSLSSVKDYDEIHDPSFAAMGDRHITKRSGKSSTSSDQEYCFNDGRRCPVQSEEEELTCAPACFSLYDCP